jgi:hypothetical protein
MPEQVDVCTNRELLPVPNRNEISREAKSVDPYEKRVRASTLQIDDRAISTSVEMQTLSRYLRLHICQRDLWGLGSLKVVVLQVRVSCLVRNHFRRSGRYISLVSELVQTYHDDDDDDDFYSSYRHPSEELHVSWYRSFHRHRS